MTMEISYDFRYLMVALSFLIGLVAVTYWNNSNGWLSERGTSLFLIGYVGVNMMIFTPNMVQNQSIWISLAVLQCSYINAIMQDRLRYYFPLFILTLGISLQNFGVTKIEDIVILLACFVTGLLNIVPRYKVRKFAYAVWKALPMFLATIVVISSDRVIWFDSLIQYIVSFIILFICSVGFSFGLNQVNHNMRQLSHEAIYDDLTGLYNFRAFTTALDKAFRTYKKEGVLYVLYTMDIDNFKRINDQYGHLVGNVVLREVAHQLRAVASEYEGFNASVYRTGGEEFSILVVGVKQNRDLSILVTKHLQQAIRDMQIETENVTLSVTMSIGQANNEKKDTQALDVYGRADKFLYQAKQSGKDAISIQGVII